MGGILLKLHTLLSYTSVKRRRNSLVSSGLGNELIKGSSALFGVGVISELELATAENCADDLGESASYCSTNITFKTWTQRRRIVSTWGKEGREKKGGGEGERDTGVGNATEAVLEKMPVLVAIVTKGI
ncbi:hypothetical protein PoB_003198600 [Plakobranchus ocellatus]|uniref:Uncharacterized protein n=1 Tax=Plakobranchus ocellatus TaxID=259542 RepID=A0AAV4AAY3_9GAST|nr:hypothetical protein PoB_003198600 [Plakobranchus ocellatus]